MLSRAIKLNNAGDTIVEVIVVLAVLGLALSICYATANASLKDTRQAQENSIASQAVANQIEAIRVNVQNSALFSGQGFCINSSGSILSPATSSNCSIGIAAPDSITDYYCGGSQGAGSSANAVCLNSGLNSTDTFVVIANWPDVSGGGSDSVTQVYRVHP